MAGVEPVFMPERVFQLDEGGVDHNNLLFRGNVPLVRNDEAYVFGYRALEAQFQKLRRREDPSFRLDHYHLIVIMIMDDTGDYHVFAPEVASFKDASSTPLDPLALSYNRTYPGYQIPGWNPTTFHGVTITDEKGAGHPGSLIWWPIEACDGMPCNQTFLGPGNNQSYNFMGLIDFVHTTLQGAPIGGRPVLIYMHSVSGVDRAGATAIGYAMNYLGLTFSDAVKEAANGATPEPDPSYQALACAYCNQLVFPNHTANCSECSPH